MATDESKQHPIQPATDVPWSDVVRFIRQLSHDLRNQLNALELQAAFLTELATDPEVKEEVRRLRQMVSASAGSLQKITTRIGPVNLNLMSYGAANFVEDFRAKLTKDFPDMAGRVEWDIAANQAQINIDPQLLQEALLELFQNAFQSPPADTSLRFIAGTENGMLVFTLHEPKTTFELPTDNWGREPLRRVHREHYGLGLNRARGIIESHGGKLHARYDSEGAKLVTTISLPLFGGEN
jgi:K+-sensing histidine kinase KdpD